MKKYITALIALCSLGLAIQAQAQAQGENKLTPKGGEVYSPQAAKDDSPQAQAKYFYFPANQTPYCKYKIVIDSNEIKKSALAQIGGPGTGVRKDRSGHHTVIIAGDGPSCAAQFGLFAAGGHCGLVPDENGRYIVELEYHVIGDCNRIPAVCERTPGCNQGEGIEPVYIYTHVYKNETMLDGGAENMDVTLTTFEGRRKAELNNSSFGITAANYGRAAIKMPTGVILDTCAALVKVKFELLHPDPLTNKDVFYVFTFTEHEGNNPLLVSLMKTKPSLAAFVEIVRGEAHVGTHIDINPLPVNGTRACGAGKEECISSNELRKKN